MNYLRLSFAIGLLFIGTSVVSAQQKQLDNETLWASRTFVGESIGDIRSMNDGVHYTKLDRVNKQLELNQYQYKDGSKVKTLIPSGVLPDDKLISGYQFSSNEQKVLLETDVEGVYRHSYLANYFVYDLKTKKTEPLTDFSKGKQRLATFSPDGDRVAFVRNNNLFIQDFESKKEIQVTTDGEQNKIINGYPDWVNEEEFSYSKAFHWSPKGTRIAFVRFDESKVREYQLTQYGDLYPNYYRFKYPKAGEENSSVQVKIYELATDKTKICDLPTNKEFYVPRIQWTNSDDKLCIMKLNRHQNHLEFLMADLSKDHPFDISLDKIFDETSETYIEINDNLTFLDNGKQFLWNSARTGYNHLYLFGMDGKENVALTSGKWEVIDFLGLDRDNGTVYYTAAEDSPMEKGLYSVKTNGKKKRKLSAKAGYTSADFSSSFAYYINTHSDASTPPVISLHDASGKLIRVLEDNEQLRNNLAEYDLQPKEFFQFATERGDQLNGWIIKPPNFDPSIKYPVLLNVYGGPGSNTVVNSWGGHNYIWQQLMAQEGYVVVSVDPRGTMLRGTEFGHSTYLQLGKLETEDMISTAKYLGKQSYVDSERIGIQGWSYGGYLSSLCMTLGADYFKTGIAIAPVTNWRYYDTIYTERFMRTPQENPDGYDDNSPINHVEKLKGNYLIIHGSTDDNVHYQNTMMMIDALVAANKEFDSFAYPNRNHGIYGGNTRNHLFNKLTNYLKENL